MNCFVSATGTAFLFSVLLATVAKYLFGTDGQHREGMQNESEAIMADWSALTSALKTGNVRPTNKPAI